MNEEILKRIDALAAKLGVTAQYLWGVMVREAKVEGSLDGGLCVICAAVSFWCGRRAVAMINSEDDVAILPIIIAFVTGVFALGFAYSSISGFANPEYFALNGILKALK